MINPGDTLYRLVLNPMTGEFQHFVYPPEMLTFTDRIVRPLGYPTINRQRRDTVRTLRMHSGGPIFLEVVTNEKSKVLKAERQLYKRPRGIFGDISENSLHPTNNRLSKSTFHIKPPLA